MNNSAVNKTNIPLIASSLILFIIFLWIYSPVISGMVSDWYNNPSHSHGFIIPLITGYFVFRRREYLKKAVLKPANLGIVILIFGLIIYVLGYLGAAYTTTRVSMLIVLAGTILFIYGKELFSGIYFPFFFLFFMIPVPRYIYDTVAFPLKLFVTKYSVLFLEIMGIQVWREGNIIMLKNITLQVVDACSGIHSLTSLLVTGVTLAHVYQWTKFRKIILVLAAVPIAIFTNGARIVITGILANSYGNEVAEGFFHKFAGLGVFMLSVALLIGMGVLLDRLRRGDGREAL